MTDVYHEVMRTIWDHNLHFGLWTSEEDESSNRVAAERMTALHIDKLGARHGWRVLDVGRRVGTSAFRLAEASHADIVSVSPCAEHVRLANVRAEALFVDDQVRFVHGDPHAMPFCADTFDGAWGVETLPHLGDRVGVLRELARVVKPSGVVVVSDFVQRRPVPKEVLDELQPALTTYDIDELPTFAGYPKLLAAAGLHVVELLDLTAESRKTLLRMRDGAQRHYDALVAAHGEEARQYLDQLLSPVALQPSLGYVLAVARV
ncbi:SAM-dependent methyltransferase [Lentzea flava]|uniref:Methyltransferase type 11 n=1 Tax=Lentzea flava TaxID=103732 RepID=A0ABQ2UQZ6_9PSEU|nr:class I SAM-dependent methyltransferase [Lentzea flava]MCP2200866.1 Methyltransferase domain-containing protein [Lentzea flava]GGU47360.1 methyltransferase type 11 [Lentzea flava]